MVEKQSSDLIEVKLSRVELSKIFRRCWDLLEKDTQEMLKISGIVEVAENV